MKESFQFLVSLCNLFALPWEPGMRPTKPEDNLSDLYPKPYWIQNFLSHLTLTHCPWNTFGCLLGVIFLCIKYSSWKTKGGHLRLCSKLYFSWWKECDLRGRLGESLSLMTDSLSDSWGLTDKERSDQNWRFSNIVLVCVYVHLLSHVQLNKWSPTSSSVHGVFLGKNPGVRCCFLLQGIFPDHRSKPCLLH